MLSRDLRAAGDPDVQWALHHWTDGLDGSFALLYRHQHRQNPPEILAATAPTSALVVSLSSYLHQFVGLQNRQAPHDPHDIALYEASVPITSAHPSYRVRWGILSPEPRTTLVVAAFHPDEGRGDPASLPPPNIGAWLLRYVHLWWQHRVQCDRDQLMRTILNWSGVGVLLLDRRLKVTFENARAREILDSGAGLKRAGPCIDAEVSADCQRLQRLLLAAVHSSQMGARFEGTRYSAAIPLRRNRNLRPLIIKVMSLAAGSNALDDAAVMLFLSDSAGVKCNSIEGLCLLYGMTPAEGRLAYLLTAGYGIAEAATQMNVREGTARSYLKRVFAKTLTNRQAELVVVVLHSLQALMSGEEPVNTTRVLSTPDV